MQMKTNAFLSLFETSCKILPNNYRIPDSDATSQYFSMKQCEFLDKE